MKRILSNKMNKLKAVGGGEGKKERRGHVTRQRPITWRPTVTGATPSLHRIQRGGIDVDRGSFREAPSGSIRRNILPRGRPPQQQPLTFSTITTTGHVECIYLYKRKKESKKNPTRKKLDD